MDIQDIRERKTYGDQAWMKIREEAAKDMRFVSGDPWDATDRAARGNRPMIAPPEMPQYFNQVINGLAASPRGIKVSPTGNGANDQIAEFYEAKIREREYDSNATQQYLLAAENAIHRSYGFVRVDTRYGSLTSVNQEIYIDGFPDPDMVQPDPDAIRLDSGDMRDCFVFQWTDKKQAEKDHVRRSATAVASGKGDGLWRINEPGWFNGDKRLIAEYWYVDSKARKLLLVQPTSAPGGLPAQPMQVFKDEVRKRFPAGVTVIQELRDVDYPTVKMCLTNGVDILHEQDWAGKYIPIVSCYGKVLWVPEGGQVERKILSMTRLGRDPWKALCYSGCTLLEILGMVQKAPAMVVEGQLAGHEQEWADAVSTPVAFLAYKAKTAATGDMELPAPQRMNGVDAGYLQAAMETYELWRRAIQAAMSEGFLPTQAQKRNEKSGKALDKISEQAAAGTFHFVYSYEGMIKQVGEIIVDLFPKIYDYQGETGIMKADRTAGTQVINTPGDDESVSPGGDHIVTVSSAPSSASQREAADEFTDSFLQNLPAYAPLIGPDATKAILADSIRMRDLGPQGEQMADRISPRPKDGEQPNPEVQSLQQQLQQAHGMLQQAEQEKQAKIVEQQGKLQIATIQEQADTQRNQANNETKLAVAELSAKVERLSLFLEERARLGTQQHEAAMASADAAHELRLAGHGQSHEAALAAAQAAHEARQAGQDHAHDASQAQAAGDLQQTMASQQQAADSQETDV